MTDDSEGGYRRTDRSTARDAAKGAAKIRLRLNVVEALLQLERQRGYDFGGIWDEITHLISAEDGRSTSPRWVELRQLGLLELRQNPQDLRKNLTRLGDRGGPQEIQFLTPLCRELMQEPNLVSIGALIKNYRRRQRTVEERILALLPRLNERGLQNIKAAIEAILDRPKPNGSKPFAGFRP